MTDADAQDLPFDESLQQVERSLDQLKQRYAQVQRDQQRQNKLQERQTEIQSELKSTKTPALREELRKIEQELETLELNLESQLFSWAGFKEVFWQAVRFGGLGLAIGWSLAFYTLNHPTPQTPSVEQRQK
jgi:hypothetical protein